MKKISILFAMAILVMIGLVGCRPYDVPQFVEVGTNESAYVIPLDTDTDLKTEDQVAVNTEAYYKKAMVSVKKIQVHHKWEQRGRWYSNGAWVPTEKVIIVNHTPVSGRWIQDTNEAIKVETKGSQGIQVPMTFDARIVKEDGPLYLSNYGTKSLMDVLDTEVNHYFAAFCNEAFHQVEYKDANAQRDEIVKPAVASTIEYFKTQGITITQMSVYDGLIFDDPTLQDEINKQANLAAKAETAKAEQVRAEQEKQNEIKLARLEKEKIQAERENAEARARKTVAEQQILAQTTNIEMDRKRREQEIENLRLKGEAEAEAIKIRAKALEKVQFPTVVTGNDLKVLGIDSLIQEATKASK